jgi:SAM-dependent methyltransferase
MTCDIHDHGYWIGTDGLPHVGDDALAIALKDRLVGLSVVDIGCGNGFYVSRISSSPGQVVGYDGNPSTPEITSGRCGVADVTREDFDVGIYDVVLFLEVGEHIPAEYQETVIDNVCKTARQAAIVSWGIPGQGGHGHFNCQDVDVIETKFEARGFCNAEPISRKLREVSTLPWFKTNLLCMIRSEGNGIDCQGSSLEQPRPPA